MYSNYENLQTEGKYDRLMDKFVSAVLANYNSIPCLGCKLIIEKKLMEVKAGILLRQQIYE